MADPATYRPAPGEIPTSPGVYRFSDASGRVIYVGKAKNLRARLSSYFQNPAGLHPRTQKMVTTAAKVEWTIVGNEVESLTLEYSWIKEFSPRFNVMYRDDKSYPYLAVTLGEEYPRAMVTRSSHRKGVRYFGPYTHVWAIRNTLDLLLAVFKVRTCSAGVFKQAERSGRPCLLGYIDRCSAPCVGRISAADHRAIAEDLCRFLDGHTGEFTRRLKAQMLEAAAAEDFERAARLRDGLAALDKVLEANAVVLEDGSDVDIFGLAADELEASVQVFHVRGGRIRGQRGWVSERVEEMSEAGLMARLIEQVYGAAAEAAAEVAAGQAEARRKRQVKTQQATSPDDVRHHSATAIPALVVVPTMPEGAPALAQWLGDLRGAKVEIRVARRGQKRELAERVHVNAEEALSLHKARRAGDLTARSQALEELQQALDLPDIPLRIECYDVSHTQGTHQVASMVVFEDGVPKKQYYRHFNIRGENGQGAADDTAAMDEVLRRRLRRLTAERSGAIGEDEDGVQYHSGPIDPETGKARRFAYDPDLLVVDGGLPQVNAAQRVLDEMNIADLRVVGLAKRLEEVWVPGEEFPIILGRTSPALYLLQHLRDESHRFAISAHRKKRAKAMTRSALDKIPGLGAVRQNALLRQFGSVAKLRKASASEIEKVEGIGPVLAQTIVNELAKNRPGANLRGESSPSGETP